MKKAKPRKPVKIGSDVVPWAWAENKRHAHLNLWRVTPHQARILAAFLSAFADWAESREKTTR